MKKRRSLLVVLPALFAMTLAGCGGDKGGDEGGGQQQTETVAVTDVSLNTTSKMLAPTETLALAATVSPETASNKSVSWESNNEQVATVDQEGNVTAVSEGTAVITVTTADGSKTATCTVTVLSKTASHAGTVADPLDGQDALRLSTWATAPTQNSYFIFDEVTEVTTTEEEFTTKAVGKLTFKFGDFTVYGMKKTSKMVNFAAMNDIKVGDKVLVYAALQNYKGNTPETSGGYVVDINPVAVSSLVSVEGTFRIEVGGEIQPCDVEINAKDASGADIKVKAHDVAVDSSAEGTVTATAKYLDKTVDFQVTVAKKEAAVAAGNYYITGTKDNVTYYLKANGTSSAPSAVTDKDEATPVAFELQEGTLTNYKLRVVGTEPAQYLYATGAANNGLRAAADKDFVWTIEKNATEGLLDMYWVASDGNRYISMYNTQDFRTYLKASVPTFPGVEKYVEKTLESISVTNQPTKTSYYVDETFDPAGLVVKGHYTWDGGSEDKELTGYTLSQEGAFTSADVGTKEITVTYQGKTTTFNVTVAARTATLESISIEGTATTKYEDGDSYSTEGLTATAHYSDESTLDVTDLAAWSVTKEKAEIGDTSITITATYEGVSGTKDVTVEVTAKATVLTETITYSGSTTGNMDGTNQAASLGVSDANVSVIGSKENGGSNNVGLNKDGTMRLYKGNTSAITISVTGGTIRTLTINYGGTVGALTINGANVEVKANGSVVANVNSSTAVILNPHASSQTHIKSIVIAYVMA